MISYLKGTLIQIQKSSANRVMLTLEVHDIGYELQIPSRMVQQLQPIGQSIQVYTHLQIREDHQVLYGFASVAERDLFRQLISVSGIGTQLAIALLDTLGLSDLVQAIVTGNTRQLAKTPGVGNKTAERIALELKTKLSQWRQQAGLSLPVPVGVSREIQEDVEMTLLALGYTNTEVSEALNALNQDSEVAGRSDPEAWIQAGLQWLSRQ
jgi:Holliday junction DNA helicase RuvA